MKSASPALAAHYALGTTTLTQCWKVTRLDGTVFGFTSLDADVVVDGVTYVAATGFTPSAIAGHSDMSVPNLEVTGILNSASITEADLMAGLWDYAAVEIFEVNYADPSMGTLKLQSGTLGAVSVSRQEFVAEIRGLTQQMQQTVGELYSAACRADLGDTRCGVALGPLTITGSVTSVADQRTFADSALTHSDGLFNHGKLKFTSGLNAGLSMEVKLFAAKAFVLQLKMPYVIAVGDTYTVYPGCNKLLRAPQAVYGHVVSFSGVTINDAGLTQAPGFFTGGFVTWITGANANSTSAIASSAVGSLVLVTAPANAIANGDLYTASPGASASSYSGDCKLKFNNVLNFRGEPDVPGMDKLLKPAGTT